MKGVGEVGAEAVGLVKRWYGTCEGKCVLRFWFWFWVWACAWSMSRVYAVPSKLSVDDRDLSKGRELRPEPM